MLRLMLAVACVVPISCGVDAAGLNAQGERYASEWARSEDNTDFLKAHRAFEAAANMEPDNPVFHYNLGTLFAQARCYTQALPELEAAVRLKPDYADAKNNLEYVKEGIARKQSDCSTTYEVDGRVIPPLK